MSEITLDSLVKQIRVSAESTNDSVNKLSKQVADQSFYKVSENCSSLNDLENKDSVRGVSLLGLKNHAMLSYVNSLALLLLSKIEEMKATTQDDESTVAKAKDEAIKNTIIQRVVLERGVKGLEKKLSYQLDKLIRNYRKAEESKEDAKEQSLENAENEGKEEDDEEDSDLDFKPNTRALMAGSKKKVSGSKKILENGEANEETMANGKYKPPKITAVAPPSSTTLTGQAHGQDRNSNRRRKLQSMEEYLQEQGDAPREGHSIGSTIVNHGRDGVKTNKELMKEQEIQRYEEENFTRLNLTVSKKDKKQKARERKKQMENTFGGEDWSMFNNVGAGDTSGAGKRKRASSAWDRAKRKRL